MKINLVLIALAVLGFTKTTNAQFSITNGRSCDIAVLYEVSDCMPPPTGPNILCNKTYLVIAPGNTFVVPCGGPTADLYVWLLEINYVNVTGGSNALAVSDPAGGCFGFGSPYGAATAPFSCAPPSWSITWLAGNVTIL
jgi:hypothetical protein